MVHSHDLGPVIDQHPFFQGIGQTLHDLLVGCAANVRFEAGDYLAREGQAADTFYLIRTGQVAVEVDVPGKKPIILETMSEGEVLGWSWMSPPYHSTLDARAVTLVRAISFDGKCLRAKMEADPKLGYEVMRRFVPMMAHRLSLARMQLLDLYAPSVGGKKRKAGK